MNWKLSRSAGILRLLADGVPRRSADLARTLNLTRHHVSDVLLTLRRDGLIRIAGWNRNAATYLLADGKPDAERPVVLAPHDKITRVIREAEAAAGIEPGSDPELAMRVELDIKRSRANEALARMLAAGRHPDPLMRAIYAGH